MGNGIRGYVYNPPEEAVVLDTDLPQTLGGLVALELEPNGGLEVLELPGTDLDVESVPLVGDLDDLRPSEPTEQSTWSLFYIVIFYSLYY